MVAGALSMLWTGFSRHDLYGAALLHGVLLFGEHLSWMAFVGMLLIVGAGLASTWLGRAPVAAKASPES